MKLCRSFLLILMALTLIVSLSGCIIIPLSKHYEFYAEEVASVQFYDLRNQESSVHPGFDTAIDPVYTIPDEEKEAFLNDFSELRFSETVIIILAAMDPSFRYGEWVVRINFSNGQYTFYSSGGYGETLDADGKHISSTRFSCDDEDLETLIGKYYAAE